MPWRRGRAGAQPALFSPKRPLPKSSDLRVLAQRVAALPAAQQPKVLLTNGLQDVEPYFILQQNDAMHKFLKPLGLAGYRRLQWNGVHEWNFWDRSLVYAIDYFLNNGYAAKKLNDWRSAAVVS